MGKCPNLTRVLLACLKQRSTHAQGPKKRADEVVITWYLTGGTIESASTA